MSTPLSGKNGTVKFGSGPTTEAEITKWSVNKTAVTTRYASNSVAGVKRSIPGVTQLDGSIEFKLDTATGAHAGQVDFREGTTGNDMKLYIDATRFWDVTLTTFKNFRVDCDINDGTVISGSCDFECDGSWSEPTY